MLKSNALAFGMQVAPITLGGPVPLRGYVRHHPCFTAVTLDKLAKLAII